MLHVRDYAMRIVYSSREEGRKEGRRDVYPGIYV